MKAADSDQATIPFDTQGEVKKQVDADMMDWYHRARDATDRIRQNHFNKKGVVRVATTGGGPKDNAHVIVTLDESSGKADERRGEIPEESNGVRVETQTVEEWEPHEQLCDNDYWSDEDNVPGGMAISPTNSTGGTGTISPQHYEGDLSWFGWTTAAHVLGDCYTGQDIEHSLDGNYTYVGTVTKIDGFRDIAWIQDALEASPSPYNRNPTNHSEGEKIRGTLSESGLVTIDNAGQPHELYGAGSCHQSMNIKSWNGSNTVNEGCRNDRWDQMYSCHELIGGTEDGDSGALYQVEDPNNPGNWHAMGSHSGWANVGPGLANNYGPQGFTIENVYDRRWDI